MHRGNFAAQNYEEIDLEKPAREVDVRPTSDNAFVTHRTERQ
jgi:hypothetical protein